MGTEAGTRRLLGARINRLRYLQVHFKSRRSRPSRRIRFNNRRRTSPAFDLHWIRWRSPESRLEITEVPYDLSGLREASENLFNLRKTEQEAELLEKEIALNDQMQEDEIHVPYEVSDGIKVSMTLHSSTAKIGWNLRKYLILVTRLDSMWMELPDQEIIHQWVNCLQNNSLSYLGFENGVVLGQDDTTDPKDIHAIYGSAPSESIFSCMISCDEQKHPRTFLKNLHQCIVCFNECADKLLLLLHPVISY